jgi:uncharacterized RDD family membrane protein YckC
MNYAETNDRIVATLIDTGVLIVISIVFGFVLQFLGGLGTIASYAIAFIYFGYFWTTTGATIGKQQRGLKVVKEDGSALTWQDAAIRYVALYFLFGWVGVFILESKVGWHETWSKTRVVKAK